MLCFYHIEHVFGVLGAWLIRRVTPVLWYMHPADAPMLGFRTIWPAYDTFSLLHRLFAFNWVTLGEA
jgi:hypothetical protein